MTIERRSAERLRVWFEALRADPPICNTASIADLSSNGARLVCLEPRPRPGQLIRVSIRAGDGRSMELRGSVVRHAPDGFAIAFEKPNPAVRALLGPAAEGELVARAPTVSALSPIREIPALCHTESQWLSGKICAPPKRNLLDHLNSAEAFLRVRDVTSPEQSSTLSFLALRTEAIDLIIPKPGVPAILPERIGNHVARPVRCLLVEGLVEGRLDVPGKIRVSDFFMRCSPFVALQGFTLRMPDPEPTDDASIAIVNTRRLIGVCDLAFSPPPEAEG